MIDYRSREEDREDYDATIMLDMARSSERCYDSPPDSYLTLQKARVDPRASERTSTPARQVRERQDFDGDGNSRMDASSPEHLGRHWRPSSVLRAICSERR